MLGGWLAAILVVLWTPPVLARGKFWDAYGEGERAYQEKRWADCAASFWRARELRPASSDALWNATICVEASGDLERARNLYREYLALQRRDGRARQQALAALQAVERALAERSRARLVVARRAGEGGETGTGRRSPEAPVVREQVDEPESEGMRPAVGAGWALTAIGIAFAAVGVATYAHAGALNQELEHPTKTEEGAIADPTAREWDRYRSQILVEEPIAIASLSLGGAMLVTGIVLLVMDESGAASAYTPSVLVGHGRAGLLVHGRF